jgi:hypothetical protein
MRLRNAAHNIALYDAGLMQKIILTQPEYREKDPETINLYKLAATDTKNYRATTCGKTKH